MAWQMDVGGRSSHGAGRPLILLHGGLGSGEMFGPVIPALAERHQVIAVDLQGYGRTADIDRPIAGFLDEQQGQS